MTRGVTGTQAGDRALGAVMGAAIGGAAGLLSGKETDGRPTDTRGYGGSRAEAIPIDQLVAILKKVRKDPLKTPGAARQTAKIS